jgi:hypothetical protein
MKPSRKRTRPRWSLGCSGCWRGCGRTRHGSVSWPKQIRDRPGGPAGCRWASQIPVTRGPGGPAAVGDLSATAPGTGRGQGSAGREPGGPYGGVLQRGAGLPVGAVPAAARGCGFRQYQPLTSIPGQVIRLRLGPRADRPSDTTCANVTRSPSVPQADHSGSASGSAVAPQENPRSSPLHCQRRPDSSSRSSPMSIQAVSLR